MIYNQKSELQNGLIFKQMTEEYMNMNYLGLLLILIVDLNKTKKYKIPWEGGF